jgi:hypothetical protein
MSMLKDRYGNVMSTSSQAAVAKFDEACELIALSRRSIAALDAVLEDDPDCAMPGPRAPAFSCEQTDKAYLEEAERSIPRGRRGERERARAHASRGRAALAGRPHPRRDHRVCADRARASARS